MKWRIVKRWVATERRYFYYVESGREITTGLFHKTKSVEWKYEGLKLFYHEAEELLNSLKEGSKPDEVVYQED